MALGNPKDVRAYVSGSPKVVRTIRRLLFLAGMPVREIFCDAFLSSSSSTSGGRVATSAA
jgi:hypothetical protein